MAIVVEAEIEQLARALRDATDAEEVILFGSRATGAARPDSDADLLVITSGPATQASPVLDLLARYRQDGAGRVRPQLFTWSVQELRERLARGSVVARDALRDGAVLASREGGSPPPTSRHAHLVEEWNRMAASSEWLRKSEEDLRLAEVGVPAGVPWGAAYHAQQAVAKALKALIFHLGGEPGRTHELVDLAEHISGLKPAVGGDLSERYSARLEEMTPFATASRYPDYPVSEQEAMAVLETARSLIGDIRPLIKPVPPASDDSQD